MRKEGNDLKGNWFLKLVELPTKVASVFPFLIGTIYAIYRFGQLNITNLILMFVAMICLDMATTALNNFMDYKLAIKTHGFNYEQHNAIVKFNLKENTVRWVIGSLVTIAIVIGLVLFIRTDFVVLLLGMVSFFFAAIYTWGPFPISRTPLGELISGTVMGGIITFISVYIHVFDFNLIEFVWQSGKLTVTLKFYELVGILLIALPLMAGISNIMLANNTCDMEDDFENRRFTLPLVIGKRNALRLFAMVYGLGYGAVILAVLVGWLPLTCLAVMVTLFPVRRNVSKFFELQSKKETFVTSVQNFITISGVYVISLLVGVLFQ